MAEIEPSAVEATIQEIERIPRSRIPNEMSKASREQPELLAFILGSTEGMGPGVSELAGFIYIVIWRTFRNNTKGRLKTVTSEEIQAKLRENEEAFARLGDADSPVFNEETLAQIASQPVLFGYILHAIQNAEEEEGNQLSISVEDKTALILLLKTATDVLDHARAC